MGCRYGISQSKPGLWYDLGCTWPNSMARTWVLSAFGSAQIRRLLLRWVESDVSKLRADGRKGWLARSSHSQGPGHITRWREEFLTGIWSDALHWGSSAYFWISYFWRTAVQMSSRLPTEASHIWSNSFTSGIPSDKCNWQKEAPEIFFLSCRGTDDQEIV